MKFESNKKYLYETYSTGKEYIVEIINIKNGYAQMLVNGKNKTMKINIDDHGNEYITMFNKNTCVLIPSDLIR